MSTVFWPRLKPRVLSRLADLWRARAHIAEAAFLLIYARILIGHVRFGRWRASLGRIGAAPPAAPPPAPVDVYHLAHAVDRAGARLRYPFKCLPRAMALHWMLKRRGIGSTLAIGIAKGQAGEQLHDLHAWVVVGDKTVLGADPERDYHQCLALTQP